MRIGPRAHDLAQHGEPAEAGIEDENGGTSWHGSKSIRSEAGDQVFSSIWSSFRGPRRGNPESRDSGFVAARRPGMTTSAHTSASSRAHSARVLHQSCPPRKQRAQGRPGAQHAPMARVQKKMHAAVTTGVAGSSGLPCAMVLTVSFVLFPVTGLSCHRRPADLAPRQPGWALLRELSNLSASVGAPEPHDFSVRDSIARPARRDRSRPGRPAYPFARNAVRVHRIPPQRL